MKRITYIENHKYDSHDLFLVEVVEDFANILNYHELKVGEAFEGEWMIG